MLSVNCKKILNPNFTLDVNFNVENGDFVAIFGASGSGKTSLLRVLAGFETADGFAKKNSTIYFDNNFFLPPKKRNIGFLFQDYALFPNMNVIQNLLFAQNNKDKAEFLLNLSELYEYKNAKIDKLSGGQKQRVALARALMREPNLLLLDEPFSAIDTTLKSKLQDYLLKIHSTFKNTIIIVSHDIGEIYKLAKKVFVMQNGKIIKSGTCDEIFLKNQGSQKLSFAGKILDIKDYGVIKIVFVQVGSQTNEIALSQFEADNLSPNDDVIISTKAFKMNIKRI